MSSTVKTVLIVGGAAVGVFVLLKLLSPSPLAAAYGRQPANTGILTTNGIAGIAAGIAGIFKGAGSSPSSSSSSTGPSVPANFDTSNYTTTSGFEFTDSSGNFVAG